jgi:signal transduction histidine kinase
VVAKLGTSCTVALLSPDGEWLEAAAVRDLRVRAEEKLWELSSSLRIRRGQGLVGRVAETGEGVFAPTLERGEIGQRTLHSISAQVEDMGVTSLLIAPIKAGGRVIGTIATSRFGEELPFTEEHRLLLEEFADRGGLAIESARRHDVERQAREHAEDVARHKDELLAIVSHELRSPMAPIAMAIEVMREISLEDEQLIWARDTIARQMGHLARLVDDLLQISSVNIGKTTLQLERLTVATIVSQAAEANRQLLAQYRHRLSITIDPSLEVRGDAVRLVQVVSNLLDNAIKYTAPGGHIAVVTSCQDGEVMIAVSDNGIGIPSEMLERIFELFVQVDGDAREGLGIGLNLVKALVEMHGGSVHATSAGAGLGSEFVVRLPSSRS